MNARSIVALIFLTSVVLLPVHALAQPAAPSADTVQRADALYKQGVRLYSDNKWTEAEAAFRAAWELNPTFDVAYNLGNAEYRLGKYRDAAEHLAFAVRNWPLLKAASALRQTARARLDESRAQVVALTVKVNVERAEVLVDGKSVGRSPLPVEMFVTPGGHDVEAKLEGYESAKAAVQGAKGTTQTVTLTLSPEPPPGPTRASAVEPSAVAPVTGPPRTPGGAGEPTPPVTTVERRPLWPAFVAGGGALVAIGVGTGLAVAAIGKRADVDALGMGVGTGQACTGAHASSASCQALKDDAASHDTLAKAALGSFVTGGALAAAAAGLGTWWAMGARDTKSGVTLTPRVGRGAAGLDVTGAW